MNKIGIMIGSFNPVHNGHLMVMNYLLNKEVVDKIIVVPSPDSFGKSGLIDFNSRLDMLNLATVKVPEIEISDIELNLSGYTADTLRYFKNKYKGDKVFLVIGRDNLEPLTKFKDFTWISNNIPLIVLDRECNFGDGDKNDFVYIEEVLFLKDFPTTKLSSSMIREELKEGKDVWAYVPELVRDYINENKLYGSDKQCK